MEATSLDEVRKELEHARTTLTKYSYVFDDLAKASSDDESLKSLARMLGDSFQITRSAFNQIENLYLVNATLKKQVEVLKEMLLSVPEIKDNQQLREKIRKEFDERHNVWY